MVTSSYSKNKAISLPWFALLAFFFTFLVDYLFLLGKIPIFPLSLIYIGLLLLLSFSIFTKLLRFGFGLKIELVQLLSWILIAFVVFQHFVWFPQIASNGGRDVFMFMAGQTLMVPLLLWLIGTQLGEQFRASHNSRVVKVSMFLILLGFAIVLANGVIRGYLFSGTLFFMYRNYSLDRSFNYLWFGDAIAFVSLMILGLLDGQYKAQIATYLVTSLMLLFNYSRTSFIIFAVVGILYFFWKKKKPVLLFFIPFSTVLLVLITQGPFLYERFSKVRFLKRMLSIFAGLSVNESIMDRIITIKEGFSSPPIYMILGRFMDEWWRTGDPGYYIHNWLSFLMSYGLIPFILSIVIFVLLIYKANRIRDLVGDPFPLALLAYSLLAVTISRAYNWPFIWLAVGLTGYYRIENFS